MIANPPPRTSAILGAPSGADIFHDATPCISQDWDCEDTAADEPLPRRRHARLALPVDAIVYVGVQVLFVYYLQVFLNLTASIWHTSAAMLLWIGVSARDISESVYTRSLRQWLQEGGPRLLQLRICEHTPCNTARLGSSFDTCQRLKVQTNILSQRDARDEMLEEPPADQESGTAAW